MQIVNNVKLDNDRCNVSVNKDQEVTPECIQCKQVTQLILFAIQHTIQQCDMLTRKEASDYMTFFPSLPRIQAGLTEL